jgi:LysM repeat protein
MKMKRIFLFAAAIATLALVLSACQMPASTPPATSEGGTQTGAGTGFPRPEDMTSPMEGLEMMATQTALAAQGGGNGTETQATQPAGPTSEAQPTNPSPSQPEVQPSQAPAPTQESQQQQEEEKVPSPTPGVPQTYTIQKYEFPYCIARRYNVNPSELLAINGLNAYSQVLVGAVLKMPQTGNPFPGNRALVSHPTKYTVVAGDTIYKIACYFGDVDPIYMAQVNGLKSPYTLTVGETLQIP